MVWNGTHNISEVCLCPKPVFSVLTACADCTHRFLFIEHIVTLFHVFISIFFVWSDFLATKVQQSRYYYYTHCTDEQTEARRGETTCPGHTAWAFCANPTTTTIYTGEQWCLFLGRHLGPHHRSRPCLKCESQAKMFRSSAKPALSHLRTRERMCSRCRVGFSLRVFNLAFPGHVTRAYFFTLGASVSVSLKWVWHRPPG